MPTRITHWAPVAGAISVLALAGVAAAASAVVADRQAAMKQVGASMKDAAPFSSPQHPYDQAKVKALMAVIATDAQKLKGLYPADSASDPNTSADPKIWQNKADFDKRLDNLASLATAAGNSTGADAFGPAFRNLGATCQSCHAVYRMKKKS